MSEGGGMGEEFPPQEPISYLVTYELFETLMYCILPQPLKPKLIYANKHSRFDTTTVEVIRFGNVVSF